MPGGFDSGKIPVVLGLWRDILRRLGFTNDARVHISAPGVDIMITGEPEQVRHLLGVVKYELERNLRWKDRDPRAALPAPPEKKRSTKKTKVNQFVEPSELDEMDSPYAFGKPLVMPVEDDTDGGDKTRAVESIASDKARYQSDPATLVPDVQDTGDDVFAPASFESSEPGRDREVTAITSNSDEKKLEPKDKQPTEDFESTAIPDAHGRIAVLNRASTDTDPDDMTKEVLRPTNPSS